MINEGIIKINSKLLETSDLKRLDKQEKENITATGGTVKGKKQCSKNKHCIKRIECKFVLAKSYF